MVFFPKGHRTYGRAPLHVVCYVPLTNRLGVRARSWSRLLRLSSIRPMNTGVPALNFLRLIGVALQPYGGQGWAIGGDSTIQK
jgi:hypothetical protein